MPTLTDKITKAASLPKGSEERRQLLASLMVDANDIKVAMNPDTIAFVDWVIYNLNDQEWSERQLWKFAEKTLGREPTPYVAAPRKGPVLEEGDLVIPKPESTPEVNMDVSTQFKYQPCTIQDVRHDSVLVMFENGQKAEFFGTKSGKATGLFRYTPKDTYEPSDRTQFEAVYFSQPGEVSAYRKQMVQDYIDKGTARGEDRSRCYYSGVCTVFRYSADGNHIVFTLRDQQRPYSTTFSVEKGRLLYLGVLNRRPNWKADYEKDVAQIAAQAG